VEHPVTEVRERERRGGERDRERNREERRQARQKETDMIESEVQKDS
jgi:hypothetical protein